MNDFEGRFWDRDLLELERDLNSAESKITGKTPFEMMYWYIPRFEDGLTRTLELDAEIYAPPNEIRELVSERVDRMNLKTKENYDKNRFKNVKYNVGDIVYVKQAKVATGESTKLQPLKVRWLL